MRYSSVPGFTNVPVTDNRLPYAPENLLSAGVGVAHTNGLDLNLEAVVTGEQFGDDLNTIAPTPDGQRGLLPAHTIWNAAANYRATRGLTLFIAVKNLLDLAKRRPGELNFGAVNGSPNHLAIVLLNVMAKTKMVHIPYKGGAPVVIDLVAGHIQVASMGLPPAVRMVQAGKLRLDAGLRDGARHSVQSGMEQEVGGDGELEIEGRLLEYDADTCQRRNRVALHVVTHDLDAPRIRREQSGEQLKQGRLAGAVRTEQRDELTGTGGETDTADGADRPEGLDYVVQAQGRGSLACVRSDDHAERPRGCRLARRLS